MSRSNLLFVVLAPIILAAVIAAVIISIGETLLISRGIVEELLHGSLNGDAIARLVPVGVALFIAMVALAGGAIASRMAPSQADR